MYDVDKRRVRHSLGHVLLSLSDVDLTKDDLMWRDMEHASQVRSSHRGSDQETNTNSNWFDHVQFPIGCITWNFHTVK